MPNLHLHGNHQPCATCKGTGRGAIIRHAHEYETADGRTFPTRNVHAICKTCNGLGRVEVQENLTDAQLANRWANFWYHTDNMR